MGGNATWRITEWDTSEKRKQFYRDLDKKRLAMGNEICPETGKKHLQIFITFERNTGFKAMRKLLGWDGENQNGNLEPAKVSDWNYELKGMDYEIQDNRKQGSRTDMANAKQLLRDTESMREICGSYFNLQIYRTSEIYLKYMESPRTEAPEVRWYYGNTGLCKTRSVYDEFGWDKVFAPINFKWWEGYDNHEVVLLDDIRGDYCKFHEFLRLIDRYPYRVEFKGGSRQLKATHIIITSDRHWSECWEVGRLEREQLKRRIKITKLFEKDSESKPISEESDEVWTFFKNGREVKLGEKSA